MKKSEDGFMSPRLGRGSQFCKRLLAVLVSGILATTAWCASGTWTDHYNTTWTFDYSGADATITGAADYWPTVVVPEKVYVGSSPYTVKTVDAAKLQDNPAALKLKFKSKNGTFSGSFKAYVDVNGKLKATTVAVSGVLVNGVGYGTATIKKVGSVPVTVE